jgi:MazG family protein
MNSFDKLLEVAEKLNGPGGCPWDLSQTFLTLQTYLLEEVHEVIEAVDSGEKKMIVEELGDLLYTIIFYCMIAKREKKFTLDEVLDGVREKLIYRHPHIFGDVELNTPQEVMREWEKRKRKEKNHENRKSAIDGIPETLPLLAKAQKTVAKILRKHPTFFSVDKSNSSEEEIATEFFALICKAHHNAVDMEGTVRRRLAHCEKQFRKHEDT